MMRVLKPTGSIFVNLGDKYGKNKSLLLLPERYRIAATDRLGLIARSVTIWNKTNAMPESVTDRVRRVHEDWVHLTLRRRYFSSLDAIREPHSPITLARAKRARDTPRDVPGQTRQRRKETVPNPLGALPGSVWSIATKTLKVPKSVGDSHTAIFPTEWPYRLIRGFCPAEGTVLDPFGGTGTTILMAEQLGRTGISVDMSYDYCRVAAWRTNDPKQIAKARENISRA
jgi:DNA modification methylase